MIVDCHLHVWSDDEEKYPFAPGVTPPTKGSVELLNETMAAAGVDRAVIVQPILCKYDNRYVADCLRRFPGKFAAVALTDPKAPDAPDRLEELVREQGFGGMRLHLSREEDPNRLAAADMDPLWRRVEELDVCFIVLGRARDLPALEPIIGRFPAVRVVIDHLGQPPAGEEAPYPTLNNVLRLAQYPRVYVKVSNIQSVSLTEYPHRDAHGVVRRIYDAFGPERLMWGTDFPGAMRRIRYDQVLELVRTHLEFLTEEDKQWLLTKTVQQVWKFGD